MMLSRRTSKNELNEGVCHFCRSDVEDEISLGKLYRTEKVNAHYYCLLFACGLAQNGDDDTGIMGFLIDDIERELKRGQKLRCDFCKQRGATIGCSERCCRKKFHFPCGQKNKTLYLFFEFFRSYCIRHRPFQKPLTREKKGDFADCRICLNPTSAFPERNCVSLRAPCCKNSWFHRDCLQRQAFNSGYFFKCPLCNNTGNFLTEMRNFGIYIPEQDASWELEENAFHELTERHSSCDNKSCRCPYGRNYNKDGSSWKLLLCQICGSKGCHLSCGQMKVKNPIWECDECIEILQKDNSNRDGSHGPQKNALNKVQRRRNKRKRKPLSDIRTTKIEDVKNHNCVKLSKEDSDIEIDTEGSESSDEENVASKSNNSSVRTSFSGAKSLRDICIVDNSRRVQKQLKSSFIHDLDSDIGTVHSDSNSCNEVIVIDDSDSDTESVKEIGFIDNSFSGTSSFEEAGCSNWESKPHPITSPAVDDGRSFSDCIYKRGDPVNINNSQIELFQNSEHEAISKISLKQSEKRTSESKQFTGAEHFPYNILDFYSNLLSQFSCKKKSSIIIYERDSENST